MNSEYLLNTLQVQQNIAASESCSLGQKHYCVSVFLLSLSLLHKVMQAKKPAYISDRVQTVARERETRRTDHLCLQTRFCKTVTASRSFIPRCTTLWNSLPSSIHEIRDLQTFKSQQRLYIKENKTRGTKG